MLITEFYKNKEIFITGGTGSIKHSLRSHYRRILSKEKAFLIFFILDYALLGKLVQYNFKQVSQPFISPSRSIWILHERFFVLHATVSLSLCIIFLGYLGKSLIEKLLRDCPDLSKIYLLIRPKRNKTPLERLKEISNDLMYERLNREQPRAFEKIVPIIGDSSKIGLGIAAKDLELLKNVNIIVHGAANVRFDNVLSDSILLNVRGTYELLKLAANLKHLIAFIHISTAYISPFQAHIKEQIYDAPVDWRLAIKMAETFEDEILEAFKMKFTAHPNVYSFTKNLSEHVVAEFSDKLPITILRPSAVTHAMKEPEPGFVDNLKGPMGAIVGVVIGVSQLSYCNENAVMALVPIDSVTILTIVAAYKRGLETIKTKKCGLDVRNLTSGSSFNFTFNQICKAFIIEVAKEPFEHTFWAPSSNMTNNFTLFITYLFLINIPLAYFYDTLLALTKRERMIMKVMRYMVGASKTAGVFSQQVYDIQNDGMWELVKTIPESEKEKFGDDFLLNRIDHIAIYTHLRNGLKKYIFKQPLKTTPAGRLRYNIVVTLDKILKALIFLLVVTFLWKMCN